MTDSPRYRQIAQELRAAIAAGEYPVGSLLPTEAELCASHGISRHTARDALRILSEDGLVARRRRAGTVVTAPGRPPMFVQPLGGFQDLLQYGRDSRLEIVAYGPARADGVAAVFGEDPAGWWELRGLRVGQRPIGTTRILVRAEVAPVRADLERFPTVGEAIECRFGLPAARIDQEIGAVVLDGEQARLLDTEAGRPALRTLRRYCDGQGRMFLASESVHPADRFVYSMSFARER